MTLINIRNKLYSHVGFSFTSTILFLAKLYLYHFRDAGLIPFCSGQNDETFEIQLKIQFEAK